MNSPTTSLGPSGAGLKTLGVALLITGGLLYAVLGGPDDNPSGLLGALLMIPGSCSIFEAASRRLRNVPQALRVPIYDSRPHVLYLRSFQTDASTPFKVLASGFTTEEEQLADVLRPLGEMVAIGRPGELLPTPGAARTYATDSERHRLGFSFGGHHSSKAETYFKSRSMSASFSSADRPLSVLSVTTRRIRSRNPL